MQTTLASLRTLHDEMGGTATLWLGYSIQHEWVLLDRTLEQNRPGSRTDPLTFDRLNDWSEVEISLRDWDALTGLTPYGRQTIDAAALSYLIQHLYEWRETRNERALRRPEREQKKERARLIAQQANMKKITCDEFARCRTTYDTGPTHSSF